MCKFVFAICLMVLSFVASSSQAASLILGCSGTTTTQIPKDGVASDPERENIFDLSVVVNLDQRTVSGLWVNGQRGAPAHTPLPIVGADANSVSFQFRNDSGFQQRSIEGIVDRITGKIDATEIWLYKSGSMTKLNYDLRCKPTRPLF
jgi:hypothetical protein